MLPSFLLRFVSRCAHRACRQALAVVCLLAPALLPAQQTPTLTVTTRLVLLDTSVTDSKGQPVTGLTAKDFAIFEDNAPERIATFDQPAVHTLAPGVTSATVFDPADPAPFANSPVTLLILDEVNTHFSDTAYGVHSLELFLRARPATLLQPTALLVVRDSGFKLLQPFTLDRDHLLAALKTHVPEQAFQLEQSLSAGEGVGVRLDTSLAALEQIVGFTARIPGHKNIVWVGAGFPTVDPDTLTPATDQALKHMLQHVTDTLLDARASLFAVDPTSTVPTTTEITDPTQLAFAAAAGGGARNLDPFDRTLDFDRLGPVTGGRVLRGLNDVDREVAQSITTGSTYYTLGYRPTSSPTQSENQPGKFRKIKVVCLVPGLTATTHSGYYTAGSPTTLAPDTIGYDLNNAATAAIPLHAILFTADPKAPNPGPDPNPDTNPEDLGAPRSVASSSTVGSQPSGYTLHVRSADLTWTPTPEGAQTATVQILAVALSSKEKILAHTLHTETATAPSATDTHAPSQRVRFAITLPATPKATRIRLIVRDQLTGHMGTLDLQP